MGCVLAICTSATARALPLPANRIIPAPPGVQFFGYFNPADDSTDTHPDHANVAWVFGEIFQNGPDATMLASLKASGMGALLCVLNVFLHQDPNDHSGNPRWIMNGINPTTGQIDPSLTGATPAALWNVFRSTMESSTGVGSGFFNGTTVVAFDLGDEPPPDATTIGNLATIATFLKNTYPNIPREAHFTAYDIDEQTFRIPNDISWVGFDCYNAGYATSFTTCAAPDHPVNGVNQYSYGSVAYYTARLKALIHLSGPSDGSYHPRLIAFPIATVDSTLPLADAEASLLARVEREVALVENDPDFVMIMPFTGKSVGSQTPALLTYYTALGLHVANGSDRLAYPTTATGYAFGTGPEYAFDYDPNTAWNSEQWVASNPSLWAAFADPIRLTEMSVVIDQSPAGPASHMVSGVTVDGTWNNIWFPSGSFTDGQLLSQMFSNTLPAFAQVVTSTQQDPGWVAWRSQEFRTSGTTRLHPYPIGASASLTPMEEICDGTTSTAWNSGVSTGTNGGPVSITLDLGSIQPVLMIQLVVDQAPSGQTTHQIYSSSDLVTWDLVQTLTGVTSDNQVLTVPAPSNLSHFRYVKVMTTDSPSWVAWREISVFKP